MNITALIMILEDMKRKHGDLSVQIISVRWVESNLHPGAMGGGGGGISTIWHGSVKKVQLSKKYPNQLEIVTAK